MFRLAAVACAALVVGGTEGGIADWFEKNEKNKAAYFASFVPGYLAYWPHYRDVRADLASRQEAVRTESTFVTPKNLTHASESAIRAWVEQL